MPSCIGTWSAVSRHVNAVRPRTKPGCTQDVATSWRLSPRQRSAATRTPPRTASWPGSFLTLQQLVSERLVRAQVFRHRSPDIHVPLAVLQVSVASTSHPASARSRRACPRTRTRAPGAPFEAVGAEASEADWAEIEMQVRGEPRYGGITPGASLAHQGLSGSSGPGGEAAAGSCPARQQSHSNAATGL
jgi:hypothetical protein